MAELAPEVPANKKHEASPSSLTSVEVIEKRRREAQPVSPASSASVEATSATPDRTAISDRRSLTSPKGTDPDTPKGTGDRFKPGPSDATQERPSSFHLTKPIDIQIAGIIQNDLLSFAGKFTPDTGNGGMPRNIIILERIKKLTEERDNHIWGPESHQALQDYNKWKEAVLLKTAAGLKSIGAAMPPGYPLKFPTDSNGRALSDSEYANLLTGGSGKADDSTAGAAIENSKEKAESHTRTGATDVTDGLLSQTRTKGYSPLHLSPAPRPGQVPQIHIPTISDLTEMRSAKDWLNRAFEAMNDKGADILFERDKQKIGVDVPKTWVRGEGQDLDQYKSALRVGVDFVDQLAKAALAVDALRKLGATNIEYPPGINVEMKDGHLHTVIDLPEKLEELINDPRTKRYIDWFEKVSPEIQQSARELLSSTKNPFYELNYKNEELPYVMDAKGNKVSKQAVLDSKDNLVKVIDPTKEKLPEAPKGPDGQPMEHYHAVDIDMLQHRFTAKRVNPDDPNSDILVVKTVQAQQGHLGYDLRNQDIGKLMIIAGRTGVDGGTDTKQSIAEPHKPTVAKGLGDKWNAAHGFLNAEQASAKHAQEIRDVAVRRGEDPDKALRQAQAEALLKGENPPTPDSSNVAAGRSSSDIVVAKGRTGPGGEQTSDRINANDMVMCNGELVQARTLPERAADDDLVFKAGKAFDIFFDPAMFLTGGIGIANFAIRKMGIAAVRVAAREALAEAGTKETVAEAASKVANLGAGQQVHGEATRALMDQGTLQTSAGKFALADAGAEAAVGVGGFVGNNAWGHKNQPWIDQLRGIYFQAKTIPVVPGFSRFSNWTLNQVNLAEGVNSFLSNAQVAQQVLQQSGPAWLGKLADISNRTMQHAIHVVGGQMWWDDAVRAEQLYQAVAHKGEPNPLIQTLVVAEKVPEHTIFGASGTRAESRGSDAKDSHANDSKTGASNHGTRRGDSKADAHAVGTRREDSKADEHDVGTHIENSEADAHDVGAHLENSKADAVSLSQFAVYAKAAFKPDDPGGQEALDILETVGNWDKLSDAERNQAKKQWAANLSFTSGEIKELEEENQGKLTEKQIRDLMDPESRALFPSSIREKAEQFLLTRNSDKFPRIAELTSPGSFTKPFMLDYLTNSSEASKQFHDLERLRHDQAHMNANIMTASRMALLMTASSPDGSMPESLASTDVHVDAHMAYPSSTLFGFTIPQAVRPLLAEKIGLRGYVVPIESRDVSEKIDSHVVLNGLRTDLAESTRAQNGSSRSMVLSDLLARAGALSPQQFSSLVQQKLVDPNASAQDKMRVLSTAEGPVAAAVLDRLYQDYLRAQDPSLSWDAATTAKALNLAGDYQTLMKTLARTASGDADGRVARTASGGIAEAVRAMAVATYGGARQLASNLHQAIYANQILALLELQKANIEKEPGVEQTGFQPQKENPAIQSGDRQGVTPEARADGSQKANIADPTDSPQKADHAAQTEPRHSQPQKARSVTQLDGPPTISPTTQPDSPQTANPPTQSAHPEKASTSNRPDDPQNIEELNRRIAEQKKIVAKVEEERKEIIETLKSQLEGIKKGAENGEAVHLIDPVRDFFLKELEAPLPDGDASKAIQKRLDAAMTLHAMEPQNRNDGSGSASDDRNREWQGVNVPLETSVGTMQQRINSALIEAFVRSDRGQSLDILDTLPADVLQRLSASPGFADHLVDFIPSPQEAAVGPAPADYVRLLNDISKFASGEKSVFDAESQGNADALKSKLESKLISLIDARNQVSRWFESHLAFPDVQTAAIQAASLTNMQGALPSLEKLAADVDYSYPLSRAAAIKALTEMKDPALKSLVPELLNRETDQQIRRQLLALQESFKGSNLVIGQKEDNQKDQSENAARRLIQAIEIKRAYPAIAQFDKPTWQKFLQENDLPLLDHDLFVKEGQQRAQANWGTNKNREFPETTMKALFKERHAQFQRLLELAEEKEAKPATQMARAFLAQVIENGGEPITTSDTKYLLAVNHDSGTAQSYVYDENDHVFNLANKFDVDAAKTFVKLVKSEADGVDLTSHLLDNLLSNSSKVSTSSLIALADAWQAIYQSDPSHTVIDPMRFRSAINRALETQQHRMLALQSEIEQANRMTASKQSEVLTIQIRKTKLETERRQLNKLKEHLTAVLTKSSARFKTLP